MICQASEANRIFCERINENYDITYALNKKIKDGYRIKIQNEKVEIQASTTNNFIAAVGYLILLIKKNEFCNLDVKMTPKLNKRVHYMPAHFGNSFEVASLKEMERYLEDLALAGANGYGDWFDPNDMPDPYNPLVYCSTSNFLWQKKKETLKFAKRLGLETVLWVAHNVAFVNQITKELEALKGHQYKVQGQVLCPSSKKAREILINNQENFFSDLVNSKVDIDRVCYFPYDDGGCGCEKCQPYFNTFLGLSYEIHQVIKKHYKNVKADLCGWWISSAEFIELEKFMNKNDNYIEGYQASVSYNDVSIKNENIKSLKFYSFLHIGFSDNKDDVYNTSGVHIAVNRLKKIITSLINNSCEGFYTYNEGFCEDINAYIVNRLAYDESLSGIEILKDYLILNLNTSKKTINKLAEILYEMQFLNSAKAEKWLKNLLELKSDISCLNNKDWVFEHILIKAELLSYDEKIGDGTNLKTKKDVDRVLPLIEKRNERWEYMCRKIYGLGVLRHIMVYPFLYPKWYTNYEKFYKKNYGKTIPGIMNEEA